MSLIKSTNTKPEIALRKLVSAEFYPLGYRYRLHYKKLAGKPDIVFVSNKVALFVDGSFWHGHKLRNGLRLSKKYWLPKIERNMQRDKQVNKELKRMGWKVVRIWEHELRKNPQKITRIIKRALL